MSLKHFIAAPHEIPVGEFGMKPVKIKLSDLNAERNRKRDKKKQSNIDEQYVIHYEKEEDFYGVFIFELDHDLKQVLKTKFSNPYIYEFEGYFYDTQDACHRRGIYALFEYINDRLAEGQYMEIYSCWDGEEQDETNEQLDTKINLSTCQFGKYLTFSSLNELSQMIQLEEKQFITVLK